MEIMVFKLLLICISLMGATGEFSILKTPESIKFVQTSSPLQSIELSQVIFNFFGLPNAKLTNWDGLLMGNLFKRPKAVVVISVTTEQHLSIDQLQMSFPLSGDIGLMNTDYIKKMIAAIDWKDKPLLVDASVDNMLLDVDSSYEDVSYSLSSESISEYLKDSHWLENHQIGSLNVQSDDDLLFLGEVNSITRTIKKVKELKLHMKNSPAFLSFHVSNLPTDSKHADAVSLFKHVLKEMAVQLDELFNGNVVIAIVTAPVSDQNNDLKLGRQLKQTNETNENIPAKKTTKVINYNKAPKYSSNYPVIFNIILWLSIVIALALLWISWSIWHMDPGKDSVIYRMTTQRLKRD